tara:strand:+ start:952 stop:1389 length:438 start_codon:yes stop_codon:yes gene_type:complete
MAGYTRQSAASIVTGGTITAADFNDEFNQIQTAFNSTSGHNHDGTAGEGGAITSIGPAQEVTLTATAITPATTNSIDIGSVAKQFASIHAETEFVLGNTSGTDPKFRIVLDGTKLMIKHNTTNLFSIDTSGNVKSLGTNVASTTP